MDRGVSRWCMIFLREKRIEVTVVVVIGVLVVITVVVVVIFVVVAAVASQLSDSVCDCGGLCVA